MALGVDADLRPAFAKLLQIEGLDDLDRLTGSVSTFDEPPLSSRCDHIAFLKHLPVAEANTQLIRAAVEHLDRINAHLEAVQPPLERMLWLVSVTDWWIDHPEGGGHRNDGTTDLLRVCFWVGNLTNPVMSQWRVYPARSICAQIVRDALGHGTDHQVFESSIKGRLDWPETLSPERVYITGSRSALPPVAELEVIDHDSP